MADVEGRRADMRDAWLEAQTHAGLWHDRFAPVLRPKAQQFLERASKHLDGVRDRHASDGYARAFETRVALLHAHRGDIEGARTFVYEATARGRIIVGLGGGAVLEHQITLEHTWGVPVIPGSALKGLASATAHQYGGDRWRRTEPDSAGGETDAAGGEDHQSLFGDTTHAGLVTFHDAWWKPEGVRLPLDRDVMTVHHRDYYGDGVTSPADTDEPNPVSFITARGTYLVALTGPERWVTCAAEWLAVALDREGIGAKTRAGYGRMHLDPNTRLPSPAEVALRELAEHTSAAAMKGAGVTQVLQAAMQAEQQGVALADILPLIAGYVARDGDNFLRSWTRDTARSEIERGAIARYELPSADVEAAAEAWVAVRVCLRVDKKGRAEVHTEAPGLKVETQKPHVVICDDGSFDPKTAEREVWFAAEAVVEKGRKLKKIRGASKLP